MWATNSDFRLAYDTLHAIQFLNNQAMIVVAVWGAIEAIFCDQKAELRFRVSVNVASYLCPAGPKRVQRQKDIAKFYDKRSAAAHGRANLSEGDILNPIQLLQDIILKMIHTKKVPTAKDLDDHLLGDVFWTH